MPTKRFCAALARINSSSLVWMAAPSRFWMFWIRNTIRNVTIVVPVLMTSCHVSEKPKNGPTPLAKSPDWLQAAPMRENLRTSWRQSGQKQDHCPSLLNHNAKYKRLLPPCCDFANGVRSFGGIRDVLLKLVHGESGVM